MQNLIPFVKPPFLYVQHYDLLKERGLEIHDLERFIRYLKEINYYRLSAYFNIYQSEKDKFNKNVEFEDILNLYLFDRKLRILVFDAIERIEIAFRSQLIYSLSHKYGSHWQDDRTIFKEKKKLPTSRYHEDIDFYTHLQKIIGKHLNAPYPEKFIKHYRNKYDNPTNPPSWMCIELLTIGELSKLYGFLRHPQDQREISNFFNLQHNVFESWLHTLVYARNICAHHSRLWNREFRIRPEILKKASEKWLDETFYVNNHRTFYLLSMIKYLLIAANPNNNFTKKFVDIIEKYPNTPIKFLGIPTNDNGDILDWRRQALWM